MTRVLVPVAVLEGGSVSLGLMNLLGTMDVTVLGYHVLPEQTPPDQARLQYEERANEALDDIAAEFRQAGGDADHRLVFTRNRGKSIERVAAETGSRAYAISGATGPVERLLVPLTGDVAVEPILSFVAELVGDRDVGVTLFLATADAPEDGREALYEAADVLADEGIDVRTEVADNAAPFPALVDAAAGHDAIVMGERAPSLRSLLFGDEADRVAAASVGPVLVVRRNGGPERDGQERDGQQQDGPELDGREPDEQPSDGQEPDGQPSDG